MIQLQRHIEILLLSHECVIVPSFGGFMAHQIPARYDERDCLFLPPMRTLGFNPQLTLNDSLLVQSYIEAYDISYPEALRRIEQEVEEMKSHLANEGTFTMNDLGTLTTNPDGNYEFEPCEAGILSPDLYGLGNVSIKQLGDQRELPAEAPAAASSYEEQEQPAEQPALLDFVGDSESEGSRAIEVKMSWVRSAVAIAAAVVVFFLLTTPVANSNLNGPAMSQLQGNILYKLMPKDTNTLPAEPVKKSEPVKAAAKQETVQQETIQETAVQKAPVKAVAAKQDAAPTYCIVLASQVKQSNAEKFAEDLQDRGYKEARVMVYNGIVRVICGEYATESEAYRQLNKISNKPGFEDAWVFKKRMES